MTGDHIEFDSVSNNVEASQNIQLTFKSYTVTTEKASFNTDSQNLVFPEPVKIQTNDQSIDADNFHFNFNQTIGVAKNIKAVFDRMLIFGDQIDFTEKNILISDASFTTCETDDSPHYLIKSDQIYLYPNLGLMVAFNNSFHLNGLPIFWFPTYIFGSKSYSLLGTSSPIPEFGNNNREGIFVKEKLGYFINESSTGSFNFGYAGNLGIYAGFNHSFIFSPTHHLNLTTHYEGSDGVTGGLEYQITFLNSNDLDESSSDLIKSLFSTFSGNDEIPVRYFRIKYKFRELINDSRVSFKPLVSGEVQHMKLSNSGIVASIESGLGLISEETPEKLFISSKKFNMNISLKKSLSLLKDVHISAESFYLGSWYENQQKWERLFGKLNFKWTQFFIQPEISYSKKLYLYGSSVFEFEQKFAIQSDEIGLQVSIPLNPLTLSVKSDYNLEENKPRSLEIKGEWDLHCFKASLNWKTIQKQILLGVNLF